MNPTYADYERMLKTVENVPTELETTKKASTRQRDRANHLADQASSAAEAEVLKVNKFLELQLTVARTALQPLGQADLIALRVTPTGGRRSATPDDLVLAKRDLVAAVEQLKQAVVTELARLEAEDRRRAQEAADRARAEQEAAARAADEANCLAALAARQKQLVQIGSVIAAIVIVLVIILLVV